MPLEENIYVFITALFAALIMVPFLHKWALDSGAVDNPDERKVHEQPIPRIGGIAIFIALLFSSLIYIDMSREVRGLFAGGLIMFFTGLIDDLYGISPQRKILGEIGACVVTIGVGHLYIARLGNLFGLGEIVLPFWLAIPFTLFALVGIINAINLIDGLDGLAGGVSVIALSAFFVLAYQSGNAIVLALCAAMFGALLGFLKYNFYPARIFMGDAGSLVVGFFLGFFAILLTQKSSNISPVIPLMILGLPIVDTLWVMSRRIIAGVSPFKPDKTHVHHKFLNLGFEHRFTVILLYGISFFWATFSITFRWLPDYVLLLCFISIFSTGYVVLRYLRINKGYFSLFNLDSAMGIRDSKCYSCIAEKAKIFKFATFIFLIVYLGSVVIFCSVQDVQGGLWKISGIILITTLGLVLVSQDINNRFFLVSLYFSCLIITSLFEFSGSKIIWGGISLHQFTTGIIILIALSVLVQAFCPENGEFFLSTVDILILGISIVLAIAFYQTRDIFNLSESFLKGIVLFLGIKVMAAENRFHSGVAVGGVLGVLLFLVAKGLLA